MVTKLLKIPPAMLVFHRIAQAEGIFIKNLGA